MIIPALVAGSGFDNHQTPPSGGDRHLFIFGLGYSSQEIARVALAQGFKVSGTTRSAEKAKQLRSQGIEAFVYNPSPLRGEGKGEGGYASKPLKHLVKFSKKLRQNQTDVEKLLWSKLRNRQLAEVKFRRQEVIGNYIVDFIAPEQKLIIELDGGQHNESSADVARDEYLAQQGYKILRFWNAELLENLEGVLATIWNVLNEAPPHPNPLPTGERVILGGDLPTRERELVHALKNATHILSSIPPQENLGDVVLQNYAVQFHADAWLGYLSTTGVYGDWGGAWVDETSELRPNNARLERRVAAEKKWLGLGGHVFRLAGIYGPGRNALEDVKDGSARRIDKPGQVFSRIHVKDIAATVFASMQNPQPESIYNVCDDEPAPQADVVEFACGLLGAPVLPLITIEQAALSPMGREFYSANRRVSNDKIKRELGVKLRYPSYKEGLARLLLTLGKS